MDKNTFDVLKEMDNNREPGNGMLTDDEIQTLVLSLAEARGDDGFTEDEALVVLNWANRTRIEQAALECVLKGMTTVNVDPKSGEIMFKITQRGISAVDKMVVNFLTDDTLN